MDEPPDEKLALAEEVIAGLAGDPSPEARIRRAAALITKANTLVPLGRSAEELAVYDEVIDGYGADPEPALRRYVALAMLSKASELRSLELLEEVTYRYAQDPDPVIVQCVARAFLNSGTALWDAGRRDDAIARFDEAARFRSARDPDIRAVVAEAVTMKARAHHTLERYEQALPSAEQTIADYADDPDPRLRSEVIRAYGIQASALRELGRRDEQIQSHLRMYQRYQDSQDDRIRESLVLSMTSLIFALSEAGDHDGAVRVFNQIADDYGSDPNPAVASAFKLAEGAIRHAAEATSSKPGPAVPGDRAPRGTEEADTARIDELARAAEGGGDLAALTALWTAVFELGRWHFLARGDLENPHPFVGVHDGRPFVLAFTTVQRVRDFAVANDYAAADDSTYSITMTPDDVVEVAVAWAAQGIHAITFDHDVTGFFASLANLESIRAHVRGGGHQPP